MKILILAEHDNRSLKRATLHAVTAATQLGDEIDVLIAGYQCDAVIAEVKKITAIKRILVADAETYQYPLAENISELMITLAQSYQYILSAATTFGKNILPRVAALLDKSMLSDVIKIISADTFQRPIYAGNALATIKTTETIKIMTIRTTAFAAVPLQTTTDIPVEKINTVIANELSRFQSQSLTQSKRPELTSARIIVSGGRGFKSAEHFKLLEPLADCLHAAIGASRAAVDAGFAPNDYQVGQTGKVVAPDLYIAIGISGAIQHLAGMKDSKVIVAINSDADAPIFQNADYGLVGDLFKILPELQKALEQSACG